MNGKRKNRMSGIVILRAYGERGEGDEKTLETNYGTSRADMSKVFTMLD